MPTTYIDDDGTESYEPLELDDAKHILSNYKSSVQGDVDKLDTLFSKLEIASARLKVLLEDGQYHGCTIAPVLKIYSQRRGSDRTSLLRHPRRFRRKIQQRLL